MTGRRYWPRYHMAYISADTYEIVLRMFRVLQTTLFTEIRFSKSYKYDFNALTPVVEFIGEHPYGYAQIHCDEFSNPHNEIRMTLKVQKTIS